MSFFGIQKYWWKDGYLPSSQSDDEEEGSDLLEKSTRGFANRRSVGPTRLLVYTALLTCYSVLMSAAFLYEAIGSRYTGPSIIYTPARKVMNYQRVGPITVYPNEYHEDPFFGDPSPELDQRWQDRLKYATIRLSQSEFVRYNQSGILLGDGSGYLATPTAYHDLHCIRYLHKTIYPDYYFPNDTQEKRLHRDKHGRHCLHNLYHSVTCNADMTIRVMRWHPDVLLPSPVDHEHECMNWDRIDEWAKERYVDTATPGLLVHPTRGEVFPGGKYVGPDEE